MSPHRARYRVHEGRTRIEIRVKNSKQLFDARDPAPFRERDLDDEFVEYIISCAEEFSMGTPLEIMLHVSEKEMPDAEIKEAIKEYFEYEAELKRKQLSKTFKTAQLFLVIGLLTLFACLGIASLMTSFLREGLIICGWVAMWKPIELVFFDWWPHWERVKLFRKLAKTPIRFAA